MKLKLFACYDKAEEKIFSPGVGVEAVDFCGFFIENIYLATDHIEKEEEKKPFLEHFKLCNIVQLAEIEEDGTVIPNKQNLVDLKDLSFNDYLKWKEKKENVERKEDIV